MQRTLEVLKEGQHYVVVNKPSNMLVVRGRGGSQPTLLDFVKAQWGSAIRPVHRLDRVTTGCCLFAKSLFGQQALSDAFRKRIVHKTYLAIVEGAPRFKTLAIDARLQREDNPDAKTGPLAKQTIDVQGKQALTRVRVLAVGEGASLIEAKPQMGRMHQIRIHLAHVGHPIIGDAMYGAKLPYEKHGIALHALELVFPLPEGRKRETAKAPLPKRFLEELARRGMDVSKIPF